MTDPTDHATLASVTRASDARRRLMAQHDVLEQLHRELGEGIDGMDAAAKAYGADDIHTEAARAYTIYLARRIVAVVRGEEDIS